MLLNEMTGIHIQQTSATSFNSDIRIHGLKGKYTQLLRDGMPLYGGFSSGLGLLQVAPLDLHQVEIIKGSNSTLYGGGAIAGLVNLVTKKPKEESKNNVTETNNTREPSQNIQTRAKKEASIAPRRVSWRRCSAPHVLLDRLSPAAWDLSRPHGLAHGTGSCCCPISLVASSHVQ